MNCAKGIVKTVAAMAAILMTVGLSSCSPGPSSFLKQQVGSMVTIQFRRDSLGAGASTPVPPNTDSFNGADVSMGGKLTDVEPAAVVIQSINKSYWIPTDAILSVRIDK